MIAQFGDLRGDGVAEPAEVGRYHHGCDLRVQPGEVFRRADRHAEDAAPPKLGISIDDEQERVGRLQQEIGHRPGHAPGDGLPAAGQQVTIHGYGRRAGQDHGRLPNSAEKTDCVAVRVSRSTVAMERNVLNAVPKLPSL